MGSGNGVYTPENGNLTVIIRRMMISQWIAGVLHPIFRHINCIGVGIPLRV